MHQQKEKFEEAGCQVVVVSFETISSTRKYLKETSLQWPFLVDSEKNFYHYFGMGQAGFWDIWGYRTWRAYLKELFKGRLPRRGDGDIQQRGGDVLLDPDGRVRLQHIGSGPGDRPEVEQLLQFLK